MIKELFLPEKTKTRRFISKRIIGISLQEDIVSLAQVYATSSSTLIEQLQEEVIPPGAPDTHVERAGNVINTMLAKLLRYDQIRIAIPSSIVTFKELTLPFTDTEKIRMVIEYEVEPMLPFSISEAIVDFIVISQDKAKQTSQVLVAAVRTPDLQSTFDITQRIEIDPDCITVDLFATYGLYQQIPEYKQLKNATAIVDIDATSTSVSFLLDGQMRLIRNIAKGIHTIADHISTDTGKPIDETLRMLKDYGTQKSKDPRFDQAVQKYLTTFLNDIQFTLNSFSLKLNFYGETSKILFIGKGDQIKGLTKFAGLLLQIPCEHFACDKLFKGKIFSKKRFKNKTKQVAGNWTSYTIALGTAIVHTPHEEFNLRRKEFAKTHSPLMNKQLIVAAALTLLIFVTIGIRGYMQVGKLSAIASRKEKQAITRLKKIFPPGSKALREKKLAALMRKATKEVKDKRERLTPFFRENLKPIEILQDLTQTIDKRVFDVTIEKMNFTIEADTPIAEITGIFKSSRGPDFHFADFEKFVILFKQKSKLLTFAEKELVGMAEESKGVEFTFKLKLKEKEV